MQFKFSFCDRSNELQLLQESFKKEVLREHRCLAYLVQGRIGVGKSRLIDEFIDSIASTKMLASKIPDFNRDTHVIEYACKEEVKEPYTPFMEVKLQIDRRAGEYRILSRLGMLLLSMTPVHDVVDDLKKIAEEINADRYGDDTRQREIRVFRKYLKTLRNRSKRAPLVIYIHNIQWIDAHSLELLQTLIDDVDSMWGMILLEEDDVGPVNAEVRAVFNGLIEKNKMHRLVLKPMPKGFERELLETSLGPHLFTATEFEHIYTLSKGYPGLLAKYADQWIHDRWLYQEDSTWMKIDGFESKIRPPDQKLLDLIITFLQDDDISPREQAFLNRFAEEVDINSDTVSSIIELIRKCRNFGFEIVEKAHMGTIGQDAFLAYDQNRDRFIIEYIPGRTETARSISPREVKHPRLIPTKDILRNADGVLIVNDYFKGKTLRDFENEAHESHVSNVLQHAVQIAEGLSELHRNGYAHGFLRPESIILTDDGEARVAGIDASQLDLHEMMREEEYRNYLPYFSPEQTEGKKVDAKSDIFSFGVLLYEMLTGELPFKGTNKNQIKHAIRYVSPDFDHLHPPLSEELQRLLSKCLNKEPADRYASTAELVKDLKAALVRSPKISIVPEPKPEEPPPPEAQRARPPRRRLAVLTTVLLAVLAVFVAINWGKIIDLFPTQIAHDTVVIRPFESRIRTAFADSLFPEMVEYLICDDIHQTSDKTAMSESEFKTRYRGEKRVPELSVDGTITMRDTGSDIELEVKSPKRADRKTTFVIHDPSALLSNVTASMTNYILSSFDHPARKHSTFTQRWDAFASFYYGEKWWQKLEPPKAKEHFMAALDYDPNFVLARLRLAQVLTFGGSQREAKNLLPSIQPFLGQLSYVDSLKAEALAARLNGDLHGEIELLRKIYNKFPTSKEALYEVAEAYYQICNIPQAIEFYEKAVMYYPNFARAHNHLAYCYTHLGKHDIALEHFRRYVLLDSTANAYDSWGDGLMAAGAYDSAAWAKEEGLRRNPNIDYLYQALSYINLFQGKFGEAERNAEEYSRHTYGADNAATSYLLRALPCYFRHECDRSLDCCMQAIAIFDTTDVVIRDHDLHWLMGRLYLELGRIDDAKAELRTMERIIEDNNITPINYQMNIYKYCKHLKAAIAAEEGNLPLINEIVAEFDGPLRDKVKDHTSPFDLAFLDNAFGELYMEPGINRFDLAEERFKRALEYNPRFPFAHYNLCRLYERTGDTARAQWERDTFRELWAGADEDVKLLYGVTALNVQRAS